MTYFHITTLLYLLRLGITVFLGGVLLLLGETNAENPQKVSISGLDIDVSLNEGLPFLDHGTKFISGQVHTIKLCQAVLSLHIFSN